MRHVPQNRSAISPRRPVASPRCIDRLGDSGRFSRYLAQDHESILPGAGILSCVPCARSAARGSIIASRARRVSGGSIRGDAFGSPGPARERTASRIRCHDHHTQLSLPGDVDTHPVRGRFLDSGVVLSEPDRLSRVLVTSSRLGSATTRWWRRRRPQSRPGITRVAGPAGIISWAWASAGVDDPTGPVHCPEPPDLTSAPSVPL